MSTAASAKILLVDDEIDVLHFYGYRLQREGFQISTAQSGQEALAKARKEAPDLIVLDLMMPGWDGIETCRRVRELPECRDAIIVFLTAGSSRMAKAAMKQSLANDYLLKPLRPNVFLHHISHILAQKYQNPQSEPQQMLKGKEFSIDRIQHEFRDGNRIYKLSETETELLWLLAARPGRLHSLFSIRKAIAPTLKEGVSAKKTLLRLREKIGDRHIKVVPGWGYKFMPPA